MVLLIVTFFRTVVFFAAIHRYYEDLYAALFEVHSLPANKQEGVGLRCCAKDIDRLAADAIGKPLSVSLVLGGIIQDISKHSQAWFYYKLSQS